MNANIMQQQLVVHPIPIKIINTDNFAMVDELFGVDNIVAEVCGDEFMFVGLVVGILVGYSDGDKVIVLDGLNVGASVLLVTL